jgi:hypothetical protein
MHVWATIVGAVIIFTILLDAFETIVLPRRVQRGFRLTALFYRNTWRPWARAAQHIRKPSRRENFLGYFGPLSLIVLLGFWAVGLIVGFAFVQYGLGAHLQTAGEKITHWTLLYHSGETFFTLGYGDITPRDTAARVLAVMEAGMGFAFLGVVIGYLPVVYSAFTTREIEISLLDARAGSPPSAGEFLGRLGCCPEQTVLDDIFRDWERWCADLLSTHISYPVLVFFRSQHSNQSWLGALTTMLDVTSLVMTGVNDIQRDQAKLTFAMARHAVVDLAQLVNARYSPHEGDRMPPEEAQRLRAHLARNGVTLSDDPDAQRNLADLRSLYEPYADGLARRLYMTLPPWIHVEPRKDNWQGGPWDRAIQARALERGGHSTEDHF